MQINKLHFVKNIPTEINKQKLCISSSITKHTAGKNPREIIFTRKKRFRVTFSWHLCQSCLPQLMSILKHTRSPEKDASRPSRKWVSHFFIYFCSYDSLTGIQAFYCHFIMSNQSGGCAGKKMLLRMYIYFLCFFFFFANNVLICSFYHCLHLFS